MGRALFAASFQAGARSHFDVAPTSLHETRRAGGKGNA